MNDTIEVTVTLTHTRVVKAAEIRRALPLDNSGAAAGLSARAQNEGGVLTEDERRACIFDCWIANPDSFLFKQIKCENRCFEREGKDLIGVLA